MKIVLDLRDKKTRIVLMEAYVEKVFGNTFKANKSGAEGVLADGESYYDEFWIEVKKKEAHR